MSRFKGVVTQSTGSWYDVRLEDGRHFQCRLKGKFRIKGLKFTNPLAVGDHVKIFMEDLSDFAVIETLLPRKNYMIRQSPSKKYHGHIIASNIDLAIVMATLHHPRTSQGFIDRFLVTTEAYHITPVILFNKCDLYTQKEKQSQMALAEMYRSLGYESLLISATSGEGIEGLMEMMHSKVSLFSGHSGVGKSTLINKLVPGIDLKTGDVSVSTGKGMHTTTFASMLEIAEGSYIIDTPGIKEFGIIDFNAEELAGYFPEFRMFMDDCRFNNCRHIGEPGCAIKQAMEDGQIYPSRYKGYLKMYNDIDKAESWNT